MKTPHIHAAMIKEWVEDTSRVVEYYFEIQDKWIKDTDPTWCENTKYRFRHKHQDLIDQKAARPELIVQYKDQRTNSWHTTDNPDVWYEVIEYRLVGPRHKHQDLIDQKKLRPEMILEARCKDSSWQPVNSLFDWENNDNWFSGFEYRLVEPTKKKVKMWQWVIRADNDSAIMLTGFYRCESAMLTEWDGFKVIQRADWTEIEVDE